MAKPEEPPTSKRSGAGTAHSDERALDREYEMTQIREVVEGPYRIIYYIKPDQIDVLAVIHAARDLPK
jgi:plasmid stabilization system protein ParE